jgi:DNA-binding GntR family transcriptional regulator
VAVVGPAQAPKLRYRKMADEVAETLRRMILLGELAPGQRTTQDELAELLGVSTTPVREALLRLTAAGLIEASPNRYFRVVRTSRHEIRDTYWMHATLAAELTRRACEFRDAELVDTLVALEARYDAAVKIHDAPEMTEANRLFHRAINIAARSPRLVFMLKTTLRFIPDDLYPETETWGTTSISAHEAIVSAFQAGYPDEAASAASQHVLAAGELLIRLLEDRGFWHDADQAQASAK